VRLDSKDLESQLLSAQARREAQAAQIEVERARIASQRASLLGLVASCDQAKTDLARQGILVAKQDVAQVTFEQAKLKVEDLQGQAQPDGGRVESASAPAQP
jgi:multidrug resistance efflux pump